MPNNQALNEYQQRVVELRAEGISTIPTSVGLEQAINPFLNEANAELVANIQQHFDLAEPPTPADTFRLTREFKDNF